MSFTLSNCCLSIERLIYWAGWLGQWVKVMTVHAWEPEFKPRIPQREEKTSSQKWSSDIHTCTVHTHAHIHTTQKKVFLFISVPMSEWSYVCMQGCVYLRMPEAVTGILFYHFSTSFSLSLCLELAFSQLLVFIYWDRVLCCSKLFVLFEPGPHETQAGLKLTMVLRLALNSWLPAFTWDCRCVTAGGSL